MNDKLGTMEGIHGQKSKFWIMAKNQAAHFIDPKTGICECGYRPSTSTVLYMEIVEPRAVAFLGFPLCSMCVKGTDFKYTVEERVQYEKMLRDPDTIKIKAQFQQWIENLLTVTRLHMDGYCNE